MKGWKPLRAFDATTQPETANVNAGKIKGLGNQPPTAWDESLAKVQRLRQTI